MSGSVHINQRTQDNKTGWCDMITRPTCWVVECRRFQRGEHTHPMMKQISGHKYYLLHIYIGRQQRTFSSYKLCTIKTLVQLR
jgi:hypothetical protein